MRDGSVCAAARAKINLTLDILGKRPDGYHEVAMVMQSVALADRVAVRAVTGAGVELDCDLPALGAPEQNLAYRAAALLRETCGLKSGVAIELGKRIPVAAGLGGGSADAAAVLTAMNELFALGLSAAALCEIGAKLGSDVPFCILGGTQLATGRGEILRALPPLPACPVVLAKPAVSVSTAWAYKSYDAARVSERPATEAVVRALEARDLTKVSALVCNVLESVTIAAHPVIAEIKARMRRSGAMAALMSGSGPTVFALAPDAQCAARIAEDLRQMRDMEVVLTETV